MRDSICVQLIALAQIPLVNPGDDLAGVVSEALVKQGLALEEGDILVLAQKIVSKAEGRIIDLAGVTPSDRSRAVAEETGKDPRLVEVILSEAAAIVRCAPNLLIVEHRLGFVVANAGVDQSNLASPNGADRALLLPEDPDGSAAVLRSNLEQRFGVSIAVVINDSFGRPWRRGVSGVALGAAGLPSLLDKRGAVDLFGRPLRSTLIGFADEIAAAASLLMGQANEGRPVILMRGLRWEAPSSPAAELIRPKSEDLFR